MALDLLDPDTPHLTPVSPKLATVRRISAAIWLLPFVVAGAVLAVLVHPLWWIAAGAVAVLFAWIFWVIGRQVSAHRYREDAEDMIVARGRWWRSVTVVPYGRIQFIDIDEGPILRAFGLATVKLNTASASSDAQLSGLPRAEAHELRERLSGRARERMAGL
ncbi:PH domain-containing protein [Corynebacterium sp. NPDC060344]|uniref:PH domain-containing protein n=1 Tax=Corynebacterium sp. NPDC060344 TaxID=3347101 RepID=UPI003665A02D